MRNIINDKSLNDKDRMDKLIKTATDQMSDSSTSDRTKSLYKLIAGGSNNLNALLKFHDHLKNCARFSTISSC